MIKLKVTTVGNSMGVILPKELEKKLLLGPGAGGGAGSTAGAAALASRLNRQLAQAEKGGAFS